MKNVVLIVEDELLLRLQLADHFREAGHAVLEAPTADHALKVCYDRIPVHVLITDIELNGSKSGWDVAEAFRAIWQNVLVIYTSGNALDEERSVPDSFFFAKPYRSAEILAKCHQLLAARN